MLAFPLTKRTTFCEWHHKWHFHSDVFCQSCKSPVCFCLNIRLFTFCYPKCNPWSTRFQLATQKATISIPTRTMEGEFRMSSSVLLFSFDALSLTSTTVAVAGKDFVVIASDTRISEGFLIHSREQSKIFKV